MRRDEARLRKIAVHRSKVIWLLLSILSTIPIDGGTAGGEEPGAPAHQADPKQLAEAFRQSAERARPTIVTIETLSGPRKTLQWAMSEIPLRGRYGGFDTDNRNSHSSMVGYARDGTGSGIIIDCRGYVLTCHHVISGAGAVFVRMPDGRRLEPEEIYADTYTDLAVLRIVVDGELLEAHCGDSDNLAVGDWVISVGNPYGLGRSVSAGIVSATDRQLPGTVWTRLIQSDAASNPGNSGGALVNLEGEVIGICAGGYGTSEGFRGIAFAIPVNAAMRIARKLIEHGEITRCYLGCHVEAIAPEIAGHLGLPTGKGLIVHDVTPQSPSAMAGIQVGDVLTRFSGTPIRDAYHMHDILEEANPDQSCAITVFRDGDTHLINVRLGRLPSYDDLDHVLANQRPTQDARYSDAMLGLMLDDLLPETARQLGFEKRSNQGEGVLITNVVPGQVAHKQGVCAGMVIKRVNGRPTPNLTEYRKAINNQSLEKGVLMLIGTPERNYFVVFRR